MRRAMAKQAEAERERRAKVIAAEGEFQAAQRLADASAIMAREPIALQLRFLQTLVEIASGNNSTTIFPVPIDILKPFLSRKGTAPRRRDAARRPRRRRLTYRAVSHRSCQARCHTGSAAQARCGGWSI